jgi:hypothetical protein
MELRSSNGLECARWIVVERAQPASEAALICDVVLAGRYFSAPFAADSDSGAPQDFMLEMRRLAVPVRTLERLAEALGRWLDLSLHEQHSAPLTLDCEMGGLFDQYLHLVLGKRDDTLASGQPVATLSYLVGRMRGELSFVTDPTCLRAFHESITAAIH